MEDYATIVVLSDGTWDTAKHANIHVITSEQLTQLGFGDITVEQLQPLMSARLDK